MGHDKGLGLGFCCLMTPGLSKDIPLHTKWAVSLVIAYGHLNLPQVFPLRRSVNLRMLEYDLIFYFFLNF